MRRYWELIAIVGVMLAAIVFCVAVLVIVNPLGLLPNTGLSFGYYANHNIVRREISRMPDIRIVSEGYHEDVTLEGSSIVVDRRGQQVRLYFLWSGLNADSDPRRLVDDLQTKLEAHFQSGSRDETLYLPAE